MTELQPVDTGRARVLALAVLAMLLIGVPGLAVGDGGEPSEDDGSSPHWREDPAVLRHPGSYLGGAIGYANLRAWVPASSEHGDFSVGPLDTWMLSFRVGDAFCEWFALGFQVGIGNHARAEEQMGLFSLMLDLSFYPWGGLGIRPSVGLGFGYASGKEEWEFGGGGPAAVALAVLYEIRLTRLFVIAPVIQVMYVGGQDFDGMAVFAGLEFIKWFATATG